MGNFNDRHESTRFADLLSSGLVALTAVYLFTLSQQPRRTTIRGPLSRVNGDARGREATKPSEIPVRGWKYICYGLSRYRTTAFLLSQRPRPITVSLRYFRPWQRPSRFTAFSPIRTKSAVS